MTQILIDGKNIRRKLELIFDIDAKVSYDEFCKNINYQNIFLRLRKGKYYRPINRFIEHSLENDMWINKHIKNKLYLLLNYEVEEIFENGMSHDFFGYTEMLNRIRKLANNKKAFYDKEFDWTLDILKYYFTNNYMLYKQGTMVNPKLFDSEMEYKLQWQWDTEQYHKEKRGIKQMIQFSQSKIIPSKKAEYLTLMALVSQKTLYVIFNQGLIVTSEDRLHKYVDGRTFIWNISEHVNRWISYAHMEKKLKDLLASYGLATEKLDTFEILNMLLRKMCEDFNKPDFQVITKNNMPHSLQINVASKEREENKMIKNKLGVKTHKKLCDDEKTRIFSKKQTIQEWANQISFGTSF